MRKLHLVLGVTGPQPIHWLGHRDNPQATDCLPTKRENPSSLLASINRDSLGSSSTTAAFLELLEVIMTFAAWASGTSFAVCQHFILHWKRHLMLQIWGSCGFSTQAFAGCTALLLWAIFPMVFSDHHSLWCNRARFQLTGT